MGRDNLFRKILKNINLLRDEGYIINDFGNKIFYTLNINYFSKKLVIVCHGSRSSQKHKLIKFLSDKLRWKYNVVRFDFNGRGKSEGKLEDSTYSKDIEDLKRMLNKFKGTFEIYCVIGHSKAASELIIFFSKYFEEFSFVKNLVLIAPRINLLESEEYNEFLKHQESFEKQKYFIFHDDEKNIDNKITLNYIEDLKKYSDLSEEFKKEISIRTLVIHGKSDEVIKFDSINKLQEVSPYDFEFIENGTHSFKDKKTKKELFKRMKNWLYY